MTLTPEYGDYDWSVGRGYEAPANPQSGAPPGWDSIPPPPAMFHGERPMMPPMSEPPPMYRDRAMPPPPVPRPDAVDIIIDPVGIGSDAPGLDVSNLRPGRQVMVNGEATIDMVLIENRYASFAGHELDLSEQACGTIKAILALEVANKLRLEQEKVLAGAGITAEVFNQMLQTAGQSTGQDVPEVPGAQTPVVAKVPGS